jgi:hypothetical protein
MRVLIILCLLLVGCSHNGLLTKQSYQNSQQAYIQGDAKEALLNFPRGEEDGNFITTMEKGYLSLIQGKPQIRDLQSQADMLQNRVRYHVSREARTFFYVQTPEDYYASEHEVIWLHFLLSWGYSLQGKYTDACVEARIAGSLLTLPWSPTGHFDDPAMRLFLAGLWTMCGDWPEAQVDLRAAWSMDKRLAWAKDLAEREHPPKNLFLILGGPGPEPVWSPNLTANPLRSERRVSFMLRGRKSPLSVADQRDVQINSYISPDASTWYERHLARESELHEMILDSAYGTKISKEVVVSSANIIADTGKGVLVGMATGAAAAMGIFASNNNASITLNDFAAVLAVGAVIGGVSGGIYGAMDGYQKSSQDMKQELDPSIYYRFVRYLPEYLWMGWSEQELTYPVKLQTPSANIEIKQPSVVNRTSVSIANMPDNRPTSCSYTVGDSSITIKTAPDADGNCPAMPPSVW